MLYLISFFLVFIVFLLIVVFFVFKKSKPSEEEITPDANEEIRLGIASLISILKSETVERSKVEDALEKMLKYFPFPENEKDAGEHFKFIYYYAKNPLSTAKMIVQMQKRMTEKNHRYAKQIEDFQMRGVDARGK